MKLGSYKRIISSDFKSEDQPFVEQLGGNVNDGMEQLFFALSGRLTFEDNFLSTVKEIEVTVGATGNPLNRTDLLLSNNNVVKGILVISAVNKTSSSTFPTGTPFVSFTQSGTSMTINNITNLQANNRYLIRLIALN